MTTATEKRAENFLLKRFTHPRFRFEKLGEGEKGFDLWLIDKNTNDCFMVELKSTNGKYNSPSSIRQKLIFNHKDQVKKFENGDTILVRVFLGKRPYKVIVITNSVFNLGATIRQQPRYEFYGDLDYSEIEELT